jgi:signal transduction histidine kinase
MYDLSFVIAIAIDAAALMLTFIGLIQALTTPVYDRWTRVFFIIFFTNLTLYILANLASLIVSLHPEMITAYKLLSFIEALLSSLLLPGITAFLLRQSGDSFRGNKILKLVLVLFGIFLIVLVYAQFSNSIIIYGDNNYEKGPYYTLHMIIPILIMAINFSLLITRRQRLTDSQFRAFFACIVIPIICMVIQIGISGYNIVIFGSTVGVFILEYYIIIHAAQVSRERSEQLNRERMNVLILQMRPHFIYNTLTGIYYLIAQDKEKAQQAVLEFTEYLRGVFAGIAKEDTISFKEELRHVHAYTNVEMMRFEGRIFVEYDTPVLNFKLPALTLQPLVENSIRHGMKPGLIPLKIIIKSRETERGIEVSVEDDGIGFDASALMDNTENDGYPKAPKGALENIRNRLALFCGGSLEIISGPDSGTKVTIVLPKDSDQ